MLTYKAKGVLSDRDVWFAGVFTNGALEQEIVNEADALIAIGLDRVELLPRPWKPRQPIIEVDGDIDAGLRAIGSQLAPSEWDPEALHRAIVAQRERLRAPSARLTSDRVIRAASRALPHARVTVDAGAHMFPATLLWPVDEPNGMLISNGLSTMGFAVPAAMGAALVDRQRLVIALTGDGGLLMCTGELATIVREGLRVIVNVFNDRALSLIDLKQRQRQFESAGVSLPDVDWASVAAGLGMAAFTASSEAELDHALARAAAGRGATLIDARIDPAPYGDMIRTIRG